METYGYNIQWIIRHLGDLAVTDIHTNTVLQLKSRLFERGVKESRVLVLLYAVRSMLQYATEVLGLTTMDWKLIRTPRPPAREVIYLTDEELETFLAAIPLNNGWTGTPRFAGVCFRALVETLTATAMRVSEALSLNRDDIDFDKREATIVGKGNKQRVVFFTPRAISWIQRYLDLREDDSPTLFSNRFGAPLSIGAVEQTFRRVRLSANIGKPVSPHMLRHTAATLLLRKGCPIGYIKEVLGHSRLETTCRYYLGVLGKAETKRAFDQYMSIGKE